MLLIAVCLLSAMLFATGNSLQHVGANNLGGTDLPPHRIAARLATNKVWLLGSAIALTAFATHVLALGLGHVGVVQPLLLVGVVMAICFRPLLDGARAHSRELLGAVAAVAGLAIYIRAGAIYATDPVDTTHSSALVAGAAVAIVTVLLLSARRLRFNLGAVFGLCAGLLMGTGAGLLKQVLEADSLHEQLLSWQLPAALALEISGTFLNQRAYHVGAMAVTMPILNVASVLMGGAFGSLVFGELPRLDAVSATFQLAGIALAGLGLIVLARHHAALEEQAAAAADPDPDPTTQRV